MCLDRIIPKRRWGETFEGDVVAWKVFQRRNIIGRPSARLPLVFPFRANGDSWRCPQGKWIDAEGTYVTKAGPDYRSRYPAGFHVFATKEGALEFANVRAHSVVRRVRVRDVVAVGVSVVFQRHHRTLVARRMYVPRDRDMEVPR